MPLTLATTYPQSLTGLAAGWPLRVVSCGWGDGSVATADWLSFVWLLLSPPATLAIT